MAFSPADLSSYAWYDATVGVTDAGSGHVSQWNDQSGNARHLVQATDGNRPITGTRTLNGRNVLDFNGTTMLLALGSLTIASPFSILWCGQLDTVTANRSVVDLQAGGGSSLTTNDLDADTWSYLKTDSSAFVSSTRVATTAVTHSLVLVSNGASSAIYENGVQYGGTLNFGASQSGNRIAIGGAGGQFLDGVTAEVVVLSAAAISAGNRALWDDYVDWKWKGIIRRPVIIVAPSQAAQRASRW